jgi:hypothetical protein
MFLLPARLPGSFIAIRGHSVGEGDGVAPGEGVPVGDSVAVGVGDAPAAPGVGVPGAWVDTDSAMSTQLSSSATVPWTLTFVSRRFRGNRSFVSRSAGVY